MRGDIKVGAAEQHRQRAKDRRSQARIEALKAVGGENPHCMYQGCDSSHGLELHHKDPESHPVDANRNGESQSKEAIAHPERFWLLCEFHHPWGARTSLPITPFKDLRKKYKLWRFKTRVIGK